MENSLESHRIDRAQRRIPAARYTDRLFFEREKTHLWPNTWLMACAEIEVAAPGAFYELAIGDQSILIVRGTDARLRAFHNVCRHRGNQLRGGCGVAEKLRCRYHGWTWDLNGALVEIPSRESFPTLSDNDAALRTCHLETWGGLVFVSMAANPPPLVTWLTPIPDCLAPYKLEPMTLLRRVSARMPANWKTVCDAFLEAYHVQGIHRQLLPYFNDLGLTYDVWSPHSRMIMPMATPSPRIAPPNDREQIRSMLEENGFHAYALRAAGWTQERDVPPGMTARSIAQAAVRQFAAAIGQDVSALSADQLVDDHHYFVFPNLVYNLFATGYLLMRYRPDARDHEAAWWDLWVFARTPAKQDLPALEVLTEPMGKVGLIADQDFENLPGVQRGMHSSSFDSLVLSEQEERVLAFHAEIDKRLFAL